MADNSKKMFGVEITVTANGYKLREALPAYSAAESSVEYVFESLDKLVDFLRERLIPPLEKR